MLTRLHEDLICWGEWFARMVEGSSLSYPHRSTLCGFTEGCGRSTVPMCRVPNLDGSRYNKTLSLAIARLPEDQRKFLGQVYLTAEERPGRNGSRTHFYRRLHRLHITLSGLLREPPASTADNSI